VFRIGTDASPGELKSQLESRISGRSPLVYFVGARQVLRVVVGGDLSRLGHQLLRPLDHFRFLRVHSLGDFSSLACARHVSPSRIDVEQFGRRARMPTPSAREVRLAF
jgi:hypothetical protein